jgi:hypothetical protein
MPFIGTIKAFRETAPNVVKFGEVDLGSMALKRADSRDAALNGDLVITVVPAIAAPAPTAAAWAQKVTVRLLTSDGAPHDWCNMTITNGGTAGDTSSAGTASLTSRDVVFVDGVAELELKGSTHAWLDTETATCEVDLGANVLGYTIAAVTGTVTFTAP